MESDYSDQIPSAQQQLDTLRQNRSRLADRLDVQPWVSLGYGLVVFVFVLGYNLLDAPTLFIVLLALSVAVLETYRRTRGVQSKGNAPGGWVRTGLGLAGTFTFTVAAIVLHRVDAPVVLVVLAALAAGATIAATSLADDAAEVRRLREAR